jgi:uncharacterized membrane protein
VRRIQTADLTIHAPPFRRNPSRWGQRVPIAMLASVGFFLAGYMALYQWELLPNVWDPVWGEDGTARVLMSETSHTMRRWIGIPDAALGALAYLGDAIYGLAGSTRRWQYRPWLVLLFGFVVIPLGIVSAVLVGLQATVVGHWCFLCLVAATLSLTLVPLAVGEVWATLKFLGRVRRKARDLRVVWCVLWGGFHPVATEVARPGEVGLDERNYTPPRGTMWPRLVEAMLGLWLMASPFIFGIPLDRTLVWAVTLGAGGAVFVLALLSCWPRARLAHYVTVGVGIGLFFFGYLQSDWMAGFHQNHMMVGLLLAMFSILPTDTTLPPEPWRREVPE